MHKNSSIVRNSFEIAQSLLAVCYDYLITLNAGLCVFTYRIYSKSRRTPFSSCPWIDTSVVSGRSKGEEIILAIPATPSAIACAVCGDDVAILLHTHSMPIKVVLVFWGSSQDLPPKWGPHSLVDAASTYNAVQTECFVHLALHVYLIHTTLE